ncbi:MAG: ATP-binding protein [Deltaproteobacteria bacterium]
MSAPHQRSTHIRDLQRFVQQLGLARSAPAVMSCLAVSVRTLVDADRASLTLPEASAAGATGVLRVHALDGDGAIPVAARLHVATSATGQAFRTGVLQYTRDHAASSLDDARLLAEAGLGSSVNAPLVVGGATLGALNVSRHNTDAFDDEDIELLESIASVVAVHLSLHKRLDVAHSRLDRAQQLAGALRGVVDFASALFGLEQENDVYRVAAAQLPSVLDAQRWSVALESGDGKHCQILPLSGEGLRLPSQHVPLASTAVGRTLVSRRISVVADFETAELWESGYMVEHGIHSALCAPFEIAGGHVGSLNVVRAEADAFDEADELLVQQCATTISQALASCAARRSIRAAQLAAEQASHAKGAFVASVTHELRTPLNGVIGMAHILQATPLSDEQREAVETITSSSNLLYQLVNDVLDFSKVEAGRLDLNPQPFTLLTLLESTVATVRGLAQSKGLTIDVVVETGLPGSFEGDDLRLRQILTNLLSNAIKFTSEGGIVIRALSAEGGLTLEVEDTGVGIPPEAAKKIFEPFRQADSSTTRHYGGTGLGLALCRRICEAMGGEIGIRRTGETGTIFGVTLPLRATQLVPAEAAGCGETLLAERHPASILVVDDGRVNLLVARRLLGKLGYDCDEARSGAEAITRARAKRYDVVLLDLRMPGMDGIETLKHLLALDAPPARIAMLTADAQLETKRECEAAGAHAFLTKPIRTPDLVRVIIDTERRLSPA